MTNIDLEKHELMESEVQSSDSQAGTNNYGQREREVQKQSMFSHPFSFKGRIRRLEYGLSYIIYYLWYGIISIAVDGGSDAANIVCLISIIPAIWFMLAQGCKRCHDRENSGWYQIIPFYFLWMLFADGDVGENNYGPNPKGINM